MEANSKLNQESTYASLPENNEWHRKNFKSSNKVKSQNKFYNELLLKRTEPPKYTPEEGEIVEIFKIPKMAEKIGLECNHSDTSPTQSKLNRRRSKLVHLELHNYEKN